MNAQPLVSVVVATRNRPELLARALDSIAEQTLKNLEVIVIDDGSSSENVVRMRELFDDLDDRFRLHTPLQPDRSGSGPATVRNRALERASGRFIAFLDDDDVWVWPQYLETAVTALEARNLDFYFADMQGYRGESLVWDTWRLDKTELTSGERLADVIPETYIISRNDLFRTVRRRIVHLNTLVVRKTLIDRAGPFLQRLYYAEDHEFVLRQADWLQLALFGPQIVARHRFPEGNSTSLNQSVLEHHLQQVSAAQHLRAVGHSVEVRDLARREESWHLRLASDELRRLGRACAARAFAWQALATRPSLGNVRHLTLTILGRK